jgi:hypothetical protein
MTIATCWKTACDFNELEQQIRYTFAADTTDLRTSVQSVSSRLQKYVQNAAVYIEINH